MGGTMHNDYYFDSVSQELYFYGAGRRKSLQKICLNFFKWINKKLWSTLSSTITIMNTLLCHADSILVRCISSISIVVIIIIINFIVLARSKELRDVKEKMPRGGWEPCFCSPSRYQSPARARADHIKGTALGSSEVGSVLLPPWEVDPKQL